MSTPAQSNDPAPGAISSCFLKLCFSGEIEEKKDFVRVVEELTSTGGPSPRRQVSNRALVADDVRLRLGQLGVQGAIQPSGLVGVPINSVLDFLRRIAYRFVSVKKKGGASSPTCMALTVEVVGLSIPPSRVSSDRAEFPRCRCSDLPLHRPQSAHLPKQLYT